MALTPSTGWQKYTEINIDNPDVDYQMRLEIRRGSGTNDPANGIIYDENNCYYSDLRDVRVGTTPNPETATQLPMWAEEVQDGVKRVIWIKTNGASKLYLFVGNQNANKYSDGDETFKWYENNITYVSDSEQDIKPSPVPAASIERCFPDGVETIVIAYRDGTTAHAFDSGAYVTVKMSRDGGTTWTTIGTIDNSGEDDGRSGDQLVKVSETELYYFNHTMPNSSNSDTKIYKLTWDDANETFTITLHDTYTNQRIYASPAENGIIKCGVMTNYNNSSLREVYYALYNPSTKTLTTKGLIIGTGNSPNENSIQRLSDNTLIAIVRTAYSGATLGWAKSVDDGNTWQWMGWIEETVSGDFGSPLGDAVITTSNGERILIMFHNYTNLSNVITYLAIFNPQNGTFETKWQINTVTGDEGANGGLQIYETGTDYWKLYLIHEQGVEGSTSTGHAVVFRKATITETETQYGFFDDFEGTVGDAIDWTNATPTTAFYTNEVKRNGNTCCKMKNTTSVRYNFYKSLGFGKLNAKVIYFSYLVDKVFIHRLIPRSDSDERVLYSVYNNGTDTNYTAYNGSSLSTSYDTDKWVKVELQINFDDKKVKVYVDNSYLGELSSFDNPYAELDQLWFIGRTESYNIGYGYIDDFIVAKYNPSGEPTWNSFGAWQSLGGQTFYQTVEDGINLNEVLNKKIYVTVGESVGTTDVTNFKAIKTFGDNFTLLEAITRILSAYRESVDGVGLSDVLTKRAYKTASEAITLNEAVARVFNAVRAFTETLNLQDTINKTLQRITSDVVSVQDAIVKQIITEKTEAINLQEAVQRIMTFNRNASDLLSLAEQLTKKPIVTKDELVTLTDSILTQLVLVKIVEDTIALNDVLSKSIFAHRNDFITLQEILQKHLKILKSDNIILNDELITIFTKILHDSIVLNEAIQRYITKHDEENIVLNEQLNKTIYTYKEDIINILDTLQKTIIFTSALCDIITLNDVLQKNAIKRVDDNIALTDLLNIIKILHKVVSDEITLNDEVITAIVQLLPYVAIITINKLYEAQKAIEKIFDGNINISG